MPRLRTAAASPTELQRIAEFIAIFRSGVSITGVRAKTRFPPETEERLSIRRTGPILTTGFAARPVERRRFGPLQENDSRSGRRLSVSLGKSAVRAVAEGLVPR